MTTSVVVEDRPGAAVRGVAGRNRIALTVALGVILLLVLLTWLNRDRTGVGGALDPENPKPAGARAVAQVLADQGVPVDVVRGRHALARARLGEDTTVVLTNPGALGASTWKDLDARIRRTGAVLVVAGLNPVVADGLGLGQDDLSAAPDRRTVRADCDPATGLVDDLRLTSEHEAVAVRGDGCFGDRTGRQLLVDRDQHRWVLTNPFPVSNEEIDQGDNAALVLRLFGQRDRVVWYVADAGDTAATDGVRLSRLLPDWLYPSLWLLGVATLALLLVRGRRLGPLVVEPVPVRIKALESTTGLGRLYEKARDRTHAAGLLVDGSARRLAPLLGLPDGVARAELARVVAERTGRPVAEVSALFPEPATIATQVRSDADLVALAQNLHRTEEEVRSR